MKQKNLLSYIIVFILISLIVSCEEIEKDTFGNLYGIVTDSKKDEPVRAASVTLNPIGMKTATGNDGRFEYNKLEPGQYDVQVIKDGYQTYKSTVTIQAGVTTKMDIPLTEGSGTLIVDRTFLDFGSNDNIMAISISNPGTSALKWEIHQDCEWVESVTPGSGTLETKASVSVNIKINRDLLSESKIYNYNLQISSTGGNENIRLYATGDIAKGILNIDKESIDFGMKSSISFLTIRNSGQKDLNWEIITDCNWISKITPILGVVKMNNETSVTINADRTNLDPLKKHTGKILIYSDGGTKEIPVSINGEEGSDEVVVLSGLYAYYTFDDGTADDQTKKGYDGSFINNPELITDTPNGEGKAVYFRALGNEQYINIPYNPFRKKSKYSISFWLKDPSEGMIFSGIGESYREKYNYPRLVYKDSKFHFAAGYTSGTNSTPAFSTTNQIQDGKWHHIAIVVEGTEKQIASDKWPRSLYIDGKLIDSQEYTYDAYTDYPCSKIQIGGDGTGIENTKAANFKIDNVRFYERVLSREEVLTIYDSEK